jgi:hypothetical protein
MAKPSGKVHPVLIGIVLSLSIVAIVLTLFITPDSLSVNLVYQAF